MTGAASCEAAVSGRHSWIPLQQVVEGDAHFAWGTRRGLHVIEVCALCGVVSGSVSIEALADYHGEAPRGLAPDSDLASEIRGRRLLSLRSALGKWCKEVRVPGPDAYPYAQALVLLGLRAEEVGHVADMIGDECKLAEFLVEDQGWARSPSLIWRLGDVLADLTGQNVHIAWTRVEVA